MNGQSKSKFIKIRIGCRAPTWGAPPVVNKAKEGQQEPYMLFGSIAYFIALSSFTQVKASSR